MREGDVMSPVTSPIVSPIMSRVACEALFQRVAALTHGKGQLTVVISSTWRGNLRWANNDVISSGDTTDRTLSVYWNSLIPFVTNQFDDATLEQALARLQRFHRLTGGGSMLPISQPQYSSPPLFFDSTANLLAAERSKIGKTLTAPVSDAGLRAAGYLQVETNAYSVFNTQGLSAYVQQSTAQYSVTVRNNQETGSGWAGVDQNDWAKIDAPALTARAREKCVASANPRAIEPGRYVAILEPQAVHDLMQVALLGNSLDRAQAEQTANAYHLTGDQSKLGHRVLDPRITITSDPMDPLCNTLPFIVDGFMTGEPVKPRSWITNGVLTTLSYDRRYAIAELTDEDAVPSPLGYHMSGGTATIDEMIAGTERGVLVTRFSHMHLVDPSSFLYTGVTRDGLWLVEHGKITYAIKNFRFNESPLFVFNAVEQLGVPVRVFSPDYPAVVPPVKVRDFNFTSLADAV